MALTLEEKKAVVAEVSEVAKGALSASRTRWRAVPWKTPTLNA
jgi:hypothetical protein